MIARESNDAQIKLTTYLHKTDHKHSKKKAKHHLFHKLQLIFTLFKGS